MSSGFRWLASLAALAILVLELGTVQGADAHPFGPNAGAVARFGSPEGATYTNLDGFYGSSYTEPLDVPTAIGPRFDAPRNDEVIGANSRPMQLNAINPPNRIDWYATGYGAGCVEEGSAQTKDCSGLTSTGGIYKRAYVDVLNCPEGVCTYNLFWYKAISAGERHLYQLQRNWVTDRYRFRIWLDGVLLQSRTAHFTAGYVSFGTESFSFNGADYQESGHQNLSQAQNNFADAWMHIYGAASAQPPGTRGLELNRGWQLYNPHAAACAMRSDGNTRAIGSGRC